MTVSPSPLSLNLHLTLNIQYLALAVYVVLLWRNNCNTSKRKRSGQQDWIHDADRYSKNSTVDHDGYPQCNNDLRRFEANRIMRFTVREIKH
jgi:hypothetical protein